MNNQNNAFEKPPLSIEAQLERLSVRGIIIQNRNIARHYLSYISYYRFCGYAIEFEGGLLMVKSSTVVVPPLSKYWIVTCY